MNEKDKLEDIAGSGIPITIKGNEYNLGIFNMRDLADFRQYIKGQRIKLIQESISDKNERIEMTNIIINSDVDEGKEMATMDGTCFLLWKSLQKCQPEITLKDVDKLIDLDNYDEIFNILMKVGGTVKNSPKGAKKK
jgi:hypothetical protein